MKLTTMVRIEDQEVELELGTEDIRHALAECLKADGNVAEVKYGLNAAGQFLRAITPDMIEKLGEPSRNVIASFLREQAARFKPEGPIA